MLLIVIPQVSGWASEGCWKCVGDALEANHCLRSLDIDIPFVSSHGWSVMMEGLCRNERLTELFIGSLDLAGMYRVSDM